MGALFHIGRRRKGYEDDDDGLESWGLVIITWTSVETNSNECNADSTFNLLPLNASFSQRRQISNWKQPLWSSSLPKELWSTTSSKTPKMKFNIFCSAFIFLSCTIFSSHEILTCNWQIMRSLTCSDVMCNVLCDVCDVSTANVFYRFAYNCI